MIFFQPRDRFLSWIDTGSSDLWVLSSACTTCQGILDDLNNDDSEPNISALTSQVIFYPEQNFVPTDLDTTLQYGDSYTGTYASGVIGQDAISVAGLRVEVGVSFPSFILIVFLWNFTLFVYID